MFTALTLAVKFAHQPKLQDKVWVFICILKVLLENGPITNIYNDQHRDGITDISDGKYKYLKSVSDSFFSLSFNCDNEWNKFNEIPREERDKNVMLCALWFGPSKPLMTKIFKPFVEEWKSLGQTGFQWQDTVDHSIKTANVYALCAMWYCCTTFLVYWRVLVRALSLSNCSSEKRQWEKCLEETPDLRDHDTIVQIGEIAKNNEQMVHFFLPFHWHCCCEQLYYSSETVKSSKQGPSEPINSLFLFTSQFVD